MDFSTLADKLATNPVPVLLALALCALAWLVREWLKANKDHADAIKAQNEQHTAAVRALYEAHLKAVQDMNAAHLATALQVVPLAAKLSECVSLFERVVLPRGGGNNT